MILRSARAFRVILQSNKIRSLKSGDETYAISDEEAYSEKRSVEVTYYRMRLLTATSRVTLWDAILIFGSVNKDTGSVSLQLTLIRNSPSYNA